MGPDGDMTVKNSNKVQEEQLQFLRSKVKALEKSRISITSICVAFENIQRWHDDMAAGSRSHVQAETGRGVPQEVRNFDNTDGSEVNYMPKPPSRRRRVKETQGGTFRQSSNAKRT